MTTESIGIGDVSVTEGNSGTRNATFTVALSAPSTATVTVSYATANGTASAPSDYTAASGALTFAPSVVYRLTDNALLDAKYINTHTFGSGDNGYTKGVGLNRDRDQFWVRATFQLN